MTKVEDLRVWKVEIVLEFLGATKSTNDELNASMPLEINCPSFEQFLIADTMTSLADIWDKLSPEAQEDINTRLNKELEVWLYSELDLNQYDVVSVSKYKRAAAIEEDGYQIYVPFEGPMNEAKQREIHDKLNAWYEQSGINLEGLRNPSAAIYSLQREAMLLSDLAVTVWQPKTDGVRLSSIIHSETLQRPLDARTIIVLE